MVKLLKFNVKSILQDTDGERMDYGVSMSGASLEWRESMGEGIKVSVIDSGVDLYHPDLVGRIKKYANFTSPNREDVTDENGHGTHVAGIIAASKNGRGIVGVAPMASLYIAKAFDKHGMADDYSVSKSLDWLMENKVNIINMSFSSSKVPSYYDKIKKAYDMGIIIICAAGNSGNIKNRQLGYPGRFSETISVASVDMNGKVSDFSSKNVGADIAAAGFEILSCYPGGRYARFSGTSMAAPIISGAAAILQRKSKSRLGRYLTPEEMRTVLCMHCENLDKKGRDSSTGCGLFSFGRIERE
ncbi:MAG: S8 family peptidase [Monoglobales bacterium]